jgi:hemin uptake protein HemP
MPTDPTRSNRPPPPAAPRPTVKFGEPTYPSGIIPTDFLFQGTQEILINHNGEHYRLRITKNGKLILTK